MSRQRARRRTVTPSLRLLLAASREPRLWTPPVSRGDVHRRRLSGAASEHGGCMFLRPRGERQAADGPLPARELTRPRFRSGAVERTDELRETDTDTDTATDTDTDRERYSYSCRGRYRYRCRCRSSYTVMRNIYCVTCNM